MILMGSANEDRPSYMGCPDYTLPPESLFGMAFRVICHL